MTTYTHTKCLVLCASFALALTACGGSDSETTSKTKASTPDAAITSAAQAFKANDVKTLVALMVPPKELAKARAKFESDMTTMSDDDKADFNQKLALASNPEMLFALAKPQLDELAPKWDEAKQDIIQSLPMIAMLASSGGDEAAMQGVQAQIAALTPKLEALLNGIDPRDEAKLKRCIGFITDAVKATGVKSADDLQKLSFDEAQAKAGNLLKGVKQVLKELGVDTDAIAGSVTATVVEEKGDTATVSVTQTILGVTTNATTQMKKVDGAWYSAQVAQAAE